MISFTDTLWPLVADSLFPQILAHPFLAGLVDGTLPEEKFRYYVQQDALYLHDFGRALALLAARSNAAQSLLLFCDHAKNTVLVEQALHAGFLDYWKSAGVDHAPPVAQPGTVFYTSWILRIVYDRPYWEGLGACLPCYWIYREVGRMLCRQTSPHPLYQKWISTYGGAEFHQIVDAMLEQVNCTCRDLPDFQRQAVAQHFLIGCRLEYHFWDMAWKMAQWPE